MSKPFTPKVVTANALIEGDVVYLDADGGWTRDLAQAQVFEIAEDADERLSYAQAQPGEIVGAYLADVTPQGVPTHFREEFRRTGPSNYFHGKQAEAATDV